MTKEKFDECIKKIDEIVAEITAEELIQMLKKYHEYDNSAYKIKIVNEEKEE